MSLVLFEDLPQITEEGIHFVVVEEEDLEKVDIIEVQEEDLDKETNGIILVKEAKGIILPLVAKSVIASSSNVPPSRANSTVTSQSSSPSNPSTPWYVDYTTTNHITNDLGNFNLY